MEETFVPNQSNLFYSLAKTLLCLEKQAILFMRAQPSDPSFCLVVASDMNIYGVEIRNREVLKRGVYSGHTERINECVFMNTKESSLANIFVSGDDTGMLTVWDKSSEKPIYTIDTFIPHKDKYRGVFSIIATPSYIYAGCHRDINVYDVNTQKLEVSCNFSASEEVSALCLDPTENYLVSGSSEGLVNVLDLNKNLSSEECVELQIMVEQSPKFVGFVDSSLIFVFTFVETFEIFSLETCMQVCSFSAIQPEIGVQYFIPSPVLKIQNGIVTLCGGNFDGYFIILEIEPSTSKMAVKDYVKTDIAQGINSYFLAGNDIVLATDEGLISFLGAN